MKERIKKMLLQIQERDTELLDHCVRTAVLTKAIALQLGQFNDDLYDAALVHDIGKIHIPPFVLYKPAKLDEKERMAIDYHAYYSYLTVKKYKMPERTCQYVLFHHGADRPRNGIYPVPDTHILHQVEPLIAADVFDALTSRRCYCGQIQINKALLIMEKEQIVRKEVLQTLKELRGKENELYANLA